MTDRIKLTEETKIIEYLNDDGSYPTYFLKDTFPKIRNQILEEHEIIQKLLDTANMDCYEKNERLLRDFAKKLLQEKL